MVPLFAALSAGETPAVPVARLSVASGRYTVPYLIGPGKVVCGIPVTTATLLYDRSMVEYYFHRTPVLQLEGHDCDAFETKATPPRC